MYTWTYNGSFLLGDPNPDGTEPTQIDAAETLVFWLGGLSKSATSPAAGANHGPLIVDPSTGAVAIRPIVERENAYFEFKSAQLIDADGDGIPEYAPVYGQGVPYVYFDGRSYDNLGTTDNNPMNNIADDDDWAQYPPPGSSSPYSDMIQQAGVVKPYVFGAAAAGADTVPLYVNDKKFQIISAGLDGRYGAPGAFSGPGTPARKLFYTDPNQTGLAFTYYGTPALYAKEDLDNIANFSGAVLGDRSPE
jgi:hypothetical protein